MPLGPYDASPALWLASAIQGWPAQSPWDWPCMAAGMLRPRAPGRPGALTRSSAPALGIPGGQMGWDGSWNWGHAIGGPKQQNKRFWILREPKSHFTRAKEEGLRGLSAGLFRKYSTCSLITNGLLMGWIIRKTGYSSKAVRSDSAFLMVLEMSSSSRGRHSISRKSPANSLMSGATMDSKRTPIFIKITPRLPWWQPKLFKNWGLNLRCQRPQGGQKSQFIGWMTGA